MTTGGRGKASIRPPAEPETVPEGAVPEDEQELRHQIERTREQLGETVDQLAAKTDVKARARAKAAGLTGRAKASTAQVRAKAAGRGADARAQVAGKVAMTRQKAGAAGGTAKAQVQARAAPVWEATPEPLRRTVVKGASTAKQRRMPLAVAAATLIAGCLALRWWRKR